MAAAPSIAIFFLAMERAVILLLAAQGPRFLVEDLFSPLSTSDSEIYVTLRVEKPVSRQEYDRLKKIMQSVVTQFHPSAPEA